MALFLVGSDTVFFFTFILSLSLSPHSCFCCVILGFVYLHLVVIVVVGVVVVVVVVIASAATPPFVLFQYLRNVLSIIFNFLYLFHERFFFFFHLFMIEHIFFFTISSLFCSSILYFFLHFPALYSLALSLRFFLQFIACVTSLNVSSLKYFYFSPFTVSRILKLVTLLRRFFYLLCCFPFRAFNTQPVIYF